jgi:hypothetical protein
MERYSGSYHGANRFKITSVAVRDAKFPTQGGLMQPDTPVKVVQAARRGQAAFMRAGTIVVVGGRSKHAGKMGVVAKQTRFGGRVPIINKDWDDAIHVEWRFVVAIEASIVPA